ncbi:MAG TPA: hypothetical protein VJ793_13890 [Anaerolineae bacterium]|nr:hypothetical protein [Anaerolineae bacterium]
MRNTVFISSVSYRPAGAVPARLDTILASAEAALARAEEHLRRAHDARVHGVLPRVFSRAALDRYPSAADDSQAPVH